MIKKINNETDGLMDTIVGKDTVFTGTLEVKGALRVDGSVNGKIISSDTVTVGATGIVDAEIQAGTAIIAGKMNGNVVAAEKIELQAKCEMDGDLKTKSLVIEQGAVFCGACNMKDNKPNLGFLKDDAGKKPEAKQESKQEANSFKNENKF